MTVRNTLLRAVYAILIVFTLFPIDFRHLRRVQLSMEILLSTTYYIISVLILGSELAYHVLLPSLASLSTPYTLYHSSCVLS